ncbi:MAG: nitrogenase cofactor biosynthesis protein NifB [archaeon]|nr:nitrogenase cofactor biosynthesis protein NifB [archaeon]
MSQDTLVSMVIRDEVLQALRTHPCYDESAYKRFARMHLPVAPKCNVECNYCNRKYDCCNESRPGVTSEVLAPSEAIEKVRTVRTKIPELKVLAIAGPGEPLANDETFKTMNLARTEFPEMILCISTNGLQLPKYVKKLYDLGIRFVTVTINACDPKISKDIYSAVMWNGKKLTGIEAAEKLLENQLEGVRKCIELGMIVKINTVLIPGYNDKHIPELVKKVRSMGVYTVNILPLIPIKDTKFSLLDAPTPEERKKLMDLCENDVKMMRHCKQCRADAIGLLNCDRSMEFCSTRHNYRAETDITLDLKNKAPMVAVATESGTMVDSGFGNSKRFKIYSIKGGRIEFVKDVNTKTNMAVYGRSHSDHIIDVLKLLDDCSVIIVKDIGLRPQNDLIARGKKVVLLSDSVENALKKVFKL